MATSPEVFISPKLTASTVVAAEFIAVLLQMQATDCFIMSSEVVTPEYLQVEIHHFLTILFLSPFCYSSGILLIFK
jgi:hypothetical protein